MKITNHVVQQKNIAFEKLLAGDVFQDIDDGQFWIKMPLTYEVNDDDSCDKYNAYDIDNNDYGFFYFHEEVVPLNAELIITRK